MINIDLLRFINLIFLLIQIKLLFLLFCIRSKLEKIFLLINGKLNGSLKS